METTPKKNRLWLKITGIVLLIILLAGGAYAFTIYKSVKNVETSIYQPVKHQSKLRSKPVTLTTKQPFSILLLGVDERKGDRGRSDSMIVLTVNPNTDSVKMVSIPRDTRTEIVGKGTQDKINAAYAYGGIPMAMNTVEKLLNIPIDYYMKINMQGFKDIVDAVGGVTVQNTLDFTQDKYHFPVGEVALNGAQALSYTRMRHQDPNGDFGREKRQRLVIEAVLHKGADVSTLVDYNDVLQAIAKNLKTNLTIDQMIDIQKNYKDATNNIEKYQVAGKGSMINKIYYFEVSSEEQQKVSNMLRTQLELEAANK